MRARVRRRIIVLTIGFLLVVLGGLIVVRLRAVPPDVVLLVRQIATEEGVDPDLAEALLRTESGGDIEARSRVGARGLMQLMPATAREIAGREGISLDGEDDLDDPRKNVRIGVIYLRDMLRRFEASVAELIDEGTQRNPILQRHGNTSSIGIHQAPNGAALLGHSDK